MALGHVTHGHRDRPAGVDDLGAAHETVGRLQRDRADHAVADVLGDLEREGPGLPQQGQLALELVVHLGHRVGRELDVHDRSDHPGDPAGASLSRLGLGVFNSGSHCLSLTPGPTRAPVAGVWR